MALLLCGLFQLVAAQHPPIDEAIAEQPVIQEGVDYRVFDRDGNPSSVLALVSSALGDEVLLVGEEHDDMVGHAFETLLFETVLQEIGAPSASGRTVVLSLEMFERDVQYVVDEYLEGLISEDHFLRSSRPWDDYASRYRPIVEVAREHGAPIVAANAPRRYVNRVSSEGPDALEDLTPFARGFLPPLPFPGPSATYREQWDAIMTAAMVGDAPPDDEEQAGDDALEPYSMSPNVIYAQALWDASMGHAIAEALVRYLDGFVVHLAGSFHVERGTGIPERIHDYRPGTRVTSVVMTKVDDIDAWSAEDHQSLADFVVLTRKPEADAAGG